MKRLAMSMVLLILMSAMLAACGGDTAPAATPTVAGSGVPPTTAATTPIDATPVSEATPVENPPTPNTAGQDAHITVQHILIGFKDAVGFQGNPPAKAAARTQDQAKALAYDLLAKAKAGADFNQLVTDNSDDQPPGIYSMSNIGVTPGSSSEYPRDQMVPAFGNVGFTLKMGEIGIADYDAKVSPFGYHIIKRVETPPTPTPESKPAGQDDHITVQHILIGFKDAVGFQGQAPPKAATRTQDQAKALAYDLLAKAKAGADFDQLVKDNTDDQAPGIYRMSNKGVEPEATPTGTAGGTGQEYARNSMVAAFGDVGFALKVGEIGISDYDTTKSPFGYHIIKRIK